MREVPLHVDGQGSGFRIRSRNLGFSFHGSGLRNQGSGLEV